MRGIRDTFLKRVLRDQVVDTRKYRYAVQDGWLFKDIVRLPIEYLGTTKVYEPWEIVCSYAKQKTIYDK